MALSNSMETYHGHVRTPQDAIILFEACRLGLLPRVQRRLSEKERQSIRSGSVFVWDEREAGMRRWTDGKSWSASRVSGSFLTYREMEGKRGGSSYSAPVATPKREIDDGKKSDSEIEVISTEDGPDGYRYKPDGLMKQSFSITTSNGQHLHLISYYSRSHLATNSLQLPTNDPQLRNIRPQKGMYPESTVNDQAQPTVPALTRHPMPGTTFVGTSAPPYPMPQQQMMAVGAHPAYARAGPPQHYVPHPGYAVWPPTPMGTPPGHPYGAYPPPIYPPAQYGHPAYSPPHPHMHPHMVPYANGYPPQHAAVPRPLNGHPSPMPQYPQQYTHHIAPVADPLPQTAQLAPIQQTQQPTTPTPQQPSQEPAPAPAPAPTPNAMSVSTITSAPGISPSLASAPAQNNDGRVSPQATALAQEALSSLTDKPQTNGTTTTTNGVTNGATPQKIIPSIGAIINTENGDAASKADSANGSNSRSGSKSPNSATRQVQDIPREKLGFGEDRRALRELDKFGRI